MTKRQIKEEVAKAEAKLKAIQMTIEAAEVFWAENGAEEHPVFNNDLYDMLHDAEDALKHARTGKKTGFFHTTNLIMNNID